MEWKDRYVTLAGDDQSHPSIARPSQSGYTIVVWEDERDGNKDIYAQKIDNTHGIAQWMPIDGVPVCTASGDQGNPRAAYDGDGGVIIVWEDDRGASTEIRGHRIVLSTGALDSNWDPDPDGVQVCGGAGGDATRPRIVGTDDGAFVVWNDARNQSNPTGNDDLYIQYLLASDGSWPTGGNNTWTQNGLPVTSDQYAQKEAELVLDNVVPQGDTRPGVVIAYEDYRNSLWQIYATNIDANGSSVYGDVRLAQTSYAQHKPQISPTGSAVGTPNLGSIVVWEDSRNSATTGTDIYAQEISSAGSRQWSGGVSLCAASGDQTNPRLDVVRSSSPYYAVIAWEDARNSGTTGSDIYAIRLNSTNGTVNATDGSSVSSASRDQFHPCIEVVEGDYDYAYIGWEDQRSTVSDIYFQYIRVDNWSAQKSTDGEPVTKAKGAQTYPETGSTVFVFTDGRRSDLNIYAQMPGGECSGSSGMEWRDQLAKWTPSTSMANHRFVTDADGNSYVVWQEDRVNPISDPPRPEIYVQKFDKDGVPLWKNDGVLVSDTANSATTPDICLGSSGGVYAVWCELAPGQSAADVEAAEIASNGSVTSVSYSFGEGSAPRIVEDDAGGAIVAWIDSNDDLNVWGGDVSNTNWGPYTKGGTYSEPKMTKNRQGSCWIAAKDGTGLSLFTVDTGGGILEEDRGPNITNSVHSFDLSTDEIDDRNANVSYKYDAMVVVSENIGGYYYVDYYKYFVESTPLGDKIKLANSRGLGGTDAYYPSITPDSAGASGYSGGAVVAWHWLNPNTNVYNIMAQRVLNDGTRYWNAAPVTVCGGNADSKYPDIVRTGNYPVFTRGYAMIVWQDWRNGCGGTSNHLQMIDYEAAAVSACKWTSNGIILSSSGGSQTYPQIQKSAGNSACIFWADDATGDDCIRGTRMSGDYGVLVKREVAGKDDAFRNDSRITSRNYPNPFSGSTTIEFQTAESGHVQLELFDIMGKRLCTLLDANLEPGSYSISVAPEASSVSLKSGIYFYRLRVNDRSLTRPIQVVR